MILSNCSPVKESINSVISEFTRRNDQILIQKLIVKPEISGVLFTKDKNTNSHYYQISFDKGNRLVLYSFNGFSTLVEDAGAIIQ